MAAAIGSSIRTTSRAPALIADSFTARRSTSVIPDGTAITTRGGTIFRFFLHLAHEMAQHSLSSFEVRNDSVLHWANGLNVAWSSTKH